MRLKLIILSTFLCALFSVHSAHATSACQIGCDTAEAAAQVACVLEIFGEPECSIAVGVAFAACEAACAATNKSDAVVVNDVKANTIKNSDLCNGKLTPKNEELAAKFCSAQ